MKYAALLALTSAKFSKKELIEAVRVKYPAATVQQFQKLGEQLMQNFEEAEKAFEKEHPNFEHDMEEEFHAIGERYGPEAMQWFMSPSVQAAEMHKQGMFRTSQELHQVMSDAFTLYNEVVHGHFDMGW
jgi:hypothetical protein